MPPPSPILNEGWHCLHLYYRVDQAAWDRLTPQQRQAGCETVQHWLDPQREGAPQRVQTSVVSGHKADLALMIMDPDPLVIDTVRQGIRGSELGAVLVPTYSFVSLTEISEYVPTLEQYAAKLTADGLGPDNPSHAARLKAYEQRLPMMNKQRLYPDFPEWPVTCFYPMNKARHPLANWYTEPFSVRSALMAEHATSGIAFAGKVSQLITSSTGLDDWEWGVTLWGRSPLYLKDIVYTMRFDTASAKYAEFGPFYVSYVMPPADAIKHLKLA
ncbi:heme-dependent peroxidase [bacterium]|nr:heme-dependent peroxidase [bacterium]